MPYLIGLLLAVAVAVFAVVAGFDRDKSFYPTVAIVVASYYVLFGAMGASNSILLAEIGLGLVFCVMAVLGFHGSRWWVAAALAGHGLFDFVRGPFIHNPGVPVWWPGFCGSIDVALGAFLAFRLLRR